MYLRKIFAVSFLMLGANMAAAECSNSMPAKLIEDCIVVENSGGFFDEEKAMAEWAEMHPDKKAETKKPTVAMSDKK